MSGARKLQSPHRSATISWMVRRILRRPDGEHVFEFADEDSLLDMIEDQVDPTVTARACEDGSCGACRVLVNDEPVNACAVRWKDVPEGARLETYRDIASDMEARCAIAAFQSERPTRCRMCVPALAVTAVGLSRAGRARDAEAIDQTLENATCMCTGRGSLRRALLK